MKIDFNGREIELKYGCRAMLAFENIAEETYTGHKSFTETITFLYCVIITSANDYTITLEDVMDFVDQDMSILTEFGEWLQKQLLVQNTLKKNSKKTKTTVK